MLQIEPIQVFSDNYIWLLRRENNYQLTIVDPGDAKVVLKKCADESLTIENILITHHHSDHVGGIAQIAAAFPNAKIYGPANETIPLISVKLKEGDRVKIDSLDVTFQVMDVPGHTAGHIAYYDEKHLFCGDTLFACGCGRVFDGTMEQLCHSLSRIASLPDETLVYCAHEYTLDNIGFAKWVEPDNLALVAREERDFARIDNDKPTVPSTLGEEKLTNPFMRFDLPGVKAAAEKKVGRPLQSVCEVFETLRTWKDLEYD